jgi:hypothetical protein
MKPLPATIALLAVLLFPSWVHPALITVTSIQATVNGITLGPLAGWSLPQNLNPGQSLEVGQIGPTFSFDNSDTSGCTATPPSCLATITVQTNLGLITYTESTPTLAGRQNGIDPVNNTFNESSQFHATNLTSGPLGALSLFIGYFDNSHTDACTDTNSGALGPETPGNCKPDFNATFNRFTGATLTDGPGAVNFVTSNPNHCFTGALENSTLTNCFDNGILLLVNSTHATPEPLSALMLGLGLLTVRVLVKNRP